jgi:hypothetical protein
VYAAVALALCSSCKKTDKSMLNVPCYDSCATVQGRFITGNNEAVANVHYEIRSESKPMLGLGQTKIRRIASGVTDNSGAYSSTFALQKNEYGERPDRHVYIMFDYDRSRFHAVDWYDTFGADEYIGFKRKDTTLTADIYLTSISKLKVRLENFLPVQANDLFSVITKCGAGLNRNRSVGNGVEATQVVTEQEIIACGNEQTTVVIRKRKNGVYTATTITVATPTGQTVPVSFSF